MNKKWEFYNTDIAKVKELSEKFNISELLASVLVNREIIENDEVEIVVGEDGFIELKKYSAIDEYKDEYPSVMRWIENGMIC